MRNTDGAAEIYVGTEDDVGQAVNENAANERAPQNMPQLSHVLTAEIVRKVNFESPREFWDSLPTVSKLFMFMTFIDVALVIGYSIWQAEEMLQDGDSCRQDCVEKEEHIHVILAMVVTAIFLVVFVIEAIVQENDFELLACLLLTIVIAARVIYFVAYANYGTLKLVLAIVVVGISSISTTLLGCLTYNRFGWRVYSKLACDLRVKHAAERIIMYFAQNRFSTCTKLDFQFLVLTFIMGLVMSVQGDDLSMSENKFSLALMICTVVGFVIGVPWLIAAYFAVRREDSRMANIVSSASVITLGPAVASAVLVYADAKQGQRHAKESLAIATILLIIFRFAVCYYMRKLVFISNFKMNKNERTEYNLNYKTVSYKHPDLLPLLKGEWLIKQTAGSKNRRRFFQLSQDMTTLRWAWNSYVKMYYVEAIESDDRTHTIILQFAVEPDLVVRFENTYDYEAWKHGLTLLLALIMAPDNGLQSRSRINLERTNQKKDNKDQNFSFEAWLNRFGIKTKHHGLGSRHDEATSNFRESAHPLRDANKQFKMMLDSRQDSLQRSASQAREESYLKMGTDREDSAEISNQIQTANQHGLAGSASVTSQADASIESRNSHGSDGGFNSMQIMVESIEYDDLDFGKFLGQGAEGAVWAAWYLDTPVAVKQTNSVHELEMTLCAGQHDNVVGLRGLAKNGSSTYIVLEYCPRGTLDILLHNTMNNSRWDPPKVLQMIRCIARGLLHLHSRKPAIFHRDLKPANVFVGHGLILKVGDFGMSRQLKPQREVESVQGNRIRRTLTPGVVGTVSYSAPELLDEHLQSTEYNVERILKSDVYSFGVTLWEIVQRERPFEGQAFYEIVAGWTSDPESMKLDPFQIPKDLSQSDQKLIKSLWELTEECTAFDPDKRPTMRSVVRKLKDIHVEAQRSAGDSQV